MSDFFGADFWYLKQLRVANALCFEPKEAGLRFARVGTETTPSPDDTERLRSMFTHVVSSYLVVSKPTGVLQTLETILKKDALADAVAAETSIQELLLPTVENTSIPSAMMALWATLHGATSNASGKRPAEPTNPPAKRPNTALGGTLDRALTNQKTTAPGNGIAARTRQLAAIFATPRTHLPRSQTGHRSGTSRSNESEVARASQGRRRCAKAEEYVETAQGGRGGAETEGKR